MWSLIVPPSRVGARGLTSYWRRWWLCSRSTSWWWCCPSSCSSSPSGYSQTCRRCLTLLYNTQRMLLLMHYLPLFTPKNVFRIIWLNKLSFPTKQSVLLPNVLIKPPASKSEEGEGNQSTSSENCTTCVFIYLGFQFHSKNSLGIGVKVLVQKQYKIVTKLIINHSFENFCLFSSFLLSILSHFTCLVKI